MKLGRHILSSIAIWGAIATVGCGTLHREVKFTSAGAADPRADAQVKERFEEIRDEPLSEDEEKVVVLIDTVPAGVSLKDGILTIEEGYEHQIVGKFTMAPDMSFFPPYREGWRGGFCHPQRILLVATLFVWMIVPTYYPCFAHATLPKADMVDYFKRLGHAAGGDLVIASYILEDQEDVAQGMGYVLKRDPRASEGANVSDHSVERPGEEPGVEPKDEEPGVELEDEEPGVEEESEARDL